MSKYLVKIISPANTETAANLGFPKIWDEHRTPSLLVFFINNGYNEAEASMIYSQDFYTTELAE